MTNDPLEAIRSLTSTKAALENKLRQDWGNFRCPVMDFEGDIPSDGMNMDSEMRGPQGDQRRVDGIRVTVVNAKVTRAVDPQSAGLTSFNFFVALPGGDNPTANLNGEMGQMSASASEYDSKIDSILDLRGKRIACVGTFHEYQGAQFEARENGTKSRNGVKGEWTNKQFSTAFYKVVKVSGVGGSSGASGSAAGNARSAEISQEALTLAAQYCDSVDDESSFNNIPQTLNNLQALGIDFTDPANVGLEEAVVNKKLREFTMTPAKQQAATPA